jgi:3',5'-nucleoside bisphosphate phosphatase
MSKYDLHSHSTRSDGLLSPRELVARAATRGVTVLALTDHDDTGGLKEAGAYAEAAGMRFVNGVEVSVTWGDHTLHVVGLHVDSDHPALAAGLARVRSGRQRRAECMAAGLAQAGISGTLEGASTYVTNPAFVGRAHFARFLVAYGYARDVGAVFRRYLTAGRPGYVPHQWASLDEAVDWITASGGIAVLAHPGRYALGNAQREELLGSFKDLGGEAIEVVTGSHTADQHVTWGRYARRFGLLASVGSDFHGPGESLRDLGSLPPLPEECRPVWELF